MGEETAKLKKMSFIRDPLFTHPHHKVRSSQVFAMLGPVPVPDADMKGTHFQVCSMTNGPTIQLINDNIFNVEADALVLAMGGDSASSGALCVDAYKVGGQAFKEEFLILHQTYSANIGSTFVLPGDGFLCSNVIVTIVPSAHMNLKKLSQGLQLALANSLKCAESLKATTLALPAIGSKFTGLLDTACPYLIDALLTYFRENPSSTIRVIKFVDISIDIIQALTEALQGHADISNYTKEDYTDTPAEILARGPAAVEAYLRASQDGTKPVYKTRLMLVGQERVGKTSLIKTITGQSFSESEGITDGVDATTFVQVSLNKDNPWRVQETARTDLVKHLEDQYTDTMSALMVQQLSKSDNTLKIKDQNIDPNIPVTPEANGSSHNRGDYESSNSLDDEDESRQVLEDTISGAYGQKRRASPACVPYTILQKLLQLQLSQDDATTHQNVPEFQIWDFAGQDVYYTTHQVFLSNRAIYIVVFDLRLDLSKPVKVQIPNIDKVESRFHELTGLGFLDFWMQSIYAYTTTNHQICDVDKPQLSPPIFIVGTHRDSSDISTDPQERKRLITAKLQTISDMMSGKPYEQHVVSRFYAVENSLDVQTDTELCLLREHIVSVTKQETYMGEEIPIRWLTFEKSVAKAISEGQHFMKLTQVQVMSRDLGIQLDTELFTMLHFYHDLGTIIYFGGDDKSNSYLQDMVILDPQWLIDTFKRIITVIPRHQQWATLKTKWRRLKEEGILEDCLIDHMWHDLLPQKPALLALMEMFDLLCPQVSAEEGEAGCAYYVPACLQPCSDEKMHQELTAKETNITFYINLQGFLPDGFFHRLLVHAARWSQQESGHKPHLFYRYGNFNLDDEHSFELQMQTTKPVCIKVTVSKTPVITSPGRMRDKTDIIDAQPNAEACNSVKSFLGVALSELTNTWICGIKYEFSVVCPCSGISLASDSCHLLPLEECLTKKKVKCSEKHVWVDTAEFMTWFGSKMKCGTPNEGLYLCKTDEASNTLSDSHSSCVMEARTSDVVTAESDNAVQDDTSNAVSERNDNCVTEAGDSGVLTTEGASGVQISKPQVHGNQLCATHMYNISGDLHIH